VGRGAFLGDVKPLAWIFGGWFTVQVPTVPVMEDPGVAPGSLGASRAGYELGS
jgi:hypothetical protein